MPGAPLPRLVRTPPAIAVAPVRLELAAVERALAPCGWGVRAEPPRVAATTATIAAGECVSLVGDRRATVALLWCIAGLTRPSGGELRWVDGAGLPRTAPRRAFVGAGWRGYDCWTVRDALESAVPTGRAQADADRRIRAVARLCPSGVHEGAPLPTLSDARRWLVGVAAAVVAGARWLLLEPPTGAGDDPVVRAALERLPAARRTIVAAVGHAPGALLPGSRALLLVPVAAQARDAGAARRVAELADPRAPAARPPPASPPRSVDLPPGAP